MTHGDHSNHLPLAVAARLAALQQRQHQQQPSDQERREQQQDAGKGRMQQQQQQQHWTVTAEASGLDDRLMDRAAVLQNRLAAEALARADSAAPSEAAAVPHQPVMMVQPPSVVAPWDSHQPADGGSLSAAAEGPMDTWDSPDDFVGRMRQLVAEEPYVDPPNEDSCGDAAAELAAAAAPAQAWLPGQPGSVEDAYCRAGESLGGKEKPTTIEDEDAIAAGSAEGGSPMCASPVGGHFLGGTIQQQQGLVATGLQEQQQQQQQQQAAAVVPQHANRLLVLAGQSLARQEYAEAAERAWHALKAVGVASAAISSFSRQAEQLLAAANVLSRVEQQHWLAALQIPPYGSIAADTVASGAAAVTTPRAVRAAYRRIAGLIHPDKFSHACADVAFKALAEAHAQALALVVGGRGLASASSGGNDDDDNGDDNDDDGCDWCEGGGDSSGGWEETGAGGCGQKGCGDDFAWWSSWEADVAEGERGEPGPGPGASSSSAPTAADEEEELWHISMQELLAEVDRRQAGVFSPTSAEDAARLPVERQKRLRVARTVLASRLQCQRAEAAASADGDAGLHNGGFLRNVGGLHEDADYGWGSWKRQRL